MKPTTPREKAAAARLAKLERTMRTFLEEGTGRDLAALAATDVFLLHFLAPPRALLALADKVSEALEA